MALSNQEFDAILDDESKVTGGLAKLFHCSVQGDYTRIQTPYLYPDGDTIDLYARSPTAAQSGMVSDLGESTRWLKGQTLSPKRTPRQTSLIGDICMTFGVEFFKGALTARFKDWSVFSDVASRAAQAAIRVSDLSLTFRNRAVESVSEEVEEFLIGEHIGYEKLPKLAGRSGRIWTPHFQTHTQNRSALIYLLTTGSRSAARSVAEHVTAAWYDLNNRKVGSDPIEFVSLFDDTADVWEPTDFALVEPLSQVLRWSEPEQVAQFLKAA